MARRSRRTMASVFADFLKTIFRPKPSGEARPERRGMAFESLETRAMLASDFGAITGLIYRDTTGNGFDAGEEVVGATVNLYTDDGDGVFEPAGDDAPATADLTDAAGRYRFDGLPASSYWIEQPAQSIGSVLLSGQNSALITISALEAQGTVGAIIDDYTDTGPSISAAGPAPNSSFDFVSAPAALGGERDLFVELVSGLAGENVQLNGTAGALTFSADAAALGRYVSVWDGADNDASTINFAGLGNVDLTGGGTATAIRMLAGVDLTGATARLRVYSDASNWSEQSISIPTGSGNELLFLFSAFATGGSGPANVASVNAIELQINTTQDGTDGDVSLLETLAPTVKTQDFTNPADLSLTKTVDVANPSLGQNVTYTITVTNGGPGAANNIVVTDTLPAGVSLVSATPGQGTFLAGVWTVGSIDAGASATLQIVATVNDLASQDNTAEVTDVDEFDPDSTPGNNNPAEDDQDSANVDALSIDLSITKTVSDTTPGRNQNVTFTITVDNAGPDYATGVEVTDLLPAGMTFVSSTVGTDYNEITGVWSVGTVASGGSVTMDLVASVTTSTPKVNTAEVTDADQTDVDSTPNNNNLAEDDQFSVGLAPTIADISVTKTVDDATPDKNQDVVFLITVANGGLDAATGVEITDQLPAGLTFDSGVTSQGTYDSGTGIWTVGTINSGADATLTLTATVATIGAKTNTAELTALDQFDSDSTPGNNNAQEDDQDSIDVTPNAVDLAVTKTVDDNAPDLNQDVVFTITVTNAGTQDATNVALTDQLPAGLTLVNAAPSQGNYDQGSGVWTVGTINNAGSATLVLTATAITVGTKTNTAQVTTLDQFDSNPDNDQASADVTPVAIDLSLTKTVNDNTPGRNQNVTFTITVANAGPDNATGVVVNDDVPAGMTFVSATVSQGSYDSVSGLWTVGTVNSGASATLDIVATVTSSTQKINTAELTAADQVDVDSTPNNGEPGEDDQQSVTLTPTIADISVTKDVDDATPDKNQNVVFTITVANAGPDAATGVAVTDQLPAGLTFVSGVTSQGTYDSGGGIWTVGTINSSANATLILTATVATVGMKTNRAELTALNEFDSDSTPGNANPQEDDEDSIDVTPNVVDLSVTKTVDDDTPNRNQNIVYTVTVANAGPANATGVTITDLLQPGLTFVTSTQSQGSYNQATGVWTVGTINSAGSATLTVTATVTTSAVKTNTATVTAVGQFDSTAANDSDSVTVTPNVANLSVSKNVNDATPNPNQQVTFTITVNNAGPQAATNVTLTDQLPAGMTFVSATPSIGTYDQNAGVWTIGTIAASGSATLTITATNTTGAQKMNTARLTTADQFDPNSTPGNSNAGEDDESTITITPNVADVRLSKQVSNAAPQVGQQVTFTLTATNDGPQATTGLQVTDQLPAGLTFVSATPSVGTYNQATGVWDIGTLNSAASATLTIVATASQVGSVTNTAQVTAQNESDPDSTPNNNVATEDDQASVQVNATQIISPRLCTIVWRRS